MCSILKQIMRSEMKRLSRNNKQPVLNGYFCPVKRLSGTDVRYQCLRIELQEQISIYFHEDKI